MPVRVMLVLCLGAIAVNGQWLSYPTPGIPRTADGKPILTAPAPRAADGRPDLSGTWVTPSDRYYNNIVVDLKPEDIKPEANAIYQQRVRSFSNDAMETLCLPLGPAALTGPFRNFKIVEAPGAIVILMSDLTYRQIFTDGRRLEKDPNPSWMGYSVGHWDGDTLVVESNGFTPRVWLDWDGHPHSEELKITERFRRMDAGHMEIRMTLEDPKYYARPWTVILTAELMADTSMLEFVCNENEKDRAHMDAKGPEISDAAIPETTLARYAGIYDFTDAGQAHTLEITSGGGALYWDQDRGGKQRMMPLSETVFSMSGALLQFEQSSGAPAYLLIEMAEGEIKAVRRKN